MTPTNQQGKRHTLDPRNLVCKCGRTKLKHLENDLKNEKWKMLNFLRKTDVKQMLKELCNS